jgi:dolichol kinase
MYLEFNYFFPIIIFATCITLIINLYFTKFFIDFPIISSIIPKVLRKYEEKSLWGASYMLIAYSLIVIIFPKNIVIISMIITSISDSLAALVGIYYGEIKLVNNRTLEGTFTFFIATYLLFFLIIESINIVLMICLSFILSLIELYTPTKYDNFTIPIACSILMYICKELL